MHSRPGQAGVGKQGGRLRMAGCDRLLGTKGPLSVKQKSADPTKRPVASPSFFLVKQFSFFPEAAPRLGFSK